MKNRILTFIIGILVGSILTTICFLSFNSNNNDMPERMEPPTGQMGEPPMGPMGEPPINQGGNM